jgi:hypothetical protein
LLFFHYIMQAEIRSLSAGDPRASSSSFLALRGLAWLAIPAGVSHISAVYI